MQKVLGSYNIPPQGPKTTHLSEVYADLCSQMCNLAASVRPTSHDVLLAVEQMSINCQ